MPKHPSAKIYYGPNVFEAAQERIAWVFDEFENVAVSISGGKDSTVVLEMTAAEASKRGRSPVHAFFLDLEAEYLGTVEYMRGVNTRSDVSLTWVQIPRRMHSSTSSINDNMYIWGIGETWMREKEESSIKENIFGTNNYYKLLEAIPMTIFGGNRVAVIGGVRAEESPNRMLALTHNIVHKNVTWGKRFSSRKTGSCVFYPIYDWGWRDVWAAIHKNKWSYNSVYDKMYSLGVPIKNMRVSDLVDVTGVKTMGWVQELEPDTWQALSVRLLGANSCGDGELYRTPTKLPPMFGSWAEYRDYLLEVLITDAERRELFQRRLASMRNAYIDNPVFTDGILARREIATILANDPYVKVDNLRSNPQFRAWRKNGGYERE